MKAFHYLLESAHGVTGCRRIDLKTIEVPLSSYVGAGLPRTVSTCQLAVDKRDKRCLVIVDGELLWESLPKSGDCIASQIVSTVSTRIPYLRKPRFGDPWYRIKNQNSENGTTEVAVLEIKRHFLLLPVGNFMFRRVRDLRSLGPMYVMGEVENRQADGNFVVWRNSSY